jgi:hypothetical protein
VQRHQVSIRCVLVFGVLCHLFRLREENCATAVDGDQGEEQGKQEDRTHFEVDYFLLVLWVSVKVLGAFREAKNSPEWAHLDKSADHPLWSIAHWRRCRHNPLYHIRHAGENLDEDEHTRDESREMAADGYIHYLTNIIPLNSFGSLVSLLLH